MAPRKITFRFGKPTKSKTNGFPISKYFLFNRVQLSTQTYDHYNFKHDDHIDAFKYGLSSWYMCSIYDNNIYTRLLTERLVLPFPRPGRTTKLESAFNERQESHAILA